MAEQEQPRMKADSLYREETYTDRETGSIRRLVPVDAQGQEDGSRDTLYMGSAQMMTPMGAIPLNFEIEAASLSEAAEAFTEAATEAMQQTIKELQEMRREQASQIVVPGQGGPASGGMGGGGLGGGGIQIP